MSCKLIAAESKKSGPYSRAAARKRKEVPTLKYDPRAHTSNYFALLFHICNKTKRQPSKKQPSQWSKLLYWGRTSNSTFYLI